MRSGQLVVRYHSPWQRRAVLIALAFGALLVLYLTYEWGRFEGGYSKFAELQQRRELSAKITSLEEENEKLRGAVAAAELARDVERKSYAEIKADFTELQAQIRKRSDELTFYRGIVAPDDGAGGLRIQRFQIVADGAEGRYRLRFSLVQSMRQESAVISGGVILQVEGTQENRPTQLALGQLGGTARADGQLPFQFRYFQDIDQPIVLPDGFEPRAVNVEVRSTRMAPVRESHPWQVQTGSG
jgi:hypothetical protein